ncbi:hypothetical protein BJ085DRAFT_36112 [Dimargaris cristalligena]|uniref:Uncharacterized protein n=1 Tax=Dimargaris cristalligena TaxID=215637 RepID=A0A4P9ZTF4_9FUNG|nr:hypothetical protein BJ085DRAFT_36112 [Dimargaris cristalligena]|eukprot:RKP36866.1 hypothetical protein BJ085DRAFT_36112 [Dimargaris cristalligena]
MPGFVEEHGSPRVPELRSRLSDLTLETRSWASLTETSSEYEWLQIRSPAEASNNNQHQQSLRLSTVPRPSSTIDVLTLSIATTADLLSPSRTQEGQVRSRSASLVSPPGLSPVTCGDLLSPTSTGLSQYLEEPFGLSESALLPPPTQRRRPSVLASLLERGHSLGGAGDNLGRVEGVGVVGLRLPAPLAVANLTRSQSEAALDAFFSSPRRPDLVTAEPNLELDLVELEANGSEGIPPPPRALSGSSAARWGLSSSGFPRDPELAFNLLSRYLIENRQATLTQNDLYPRLPRTHSTWFTARAPGLDLPPLAPTASSRGVDGPAPKRPHSRKASLAGGSTGGGGIAQLEVPRLGMGGGDPPRRRDRRYRRKPSVNTDISPLARAARSTVPLALHPAGSGHPVGTGNMDPPSSEDVFSSAFAGMAAVGTWTNPVTLDSVAEYDSSALDAWDSIEFRGILAGLWSSVRRRIQPDIAEDSTDL